jgi:hypothetical protein
MTDLQNDRYFCKTMLLKIPITGVYSRSAKNLISLLLLLISVLMTAGCNAGDKDPDPVDSYAAVIDLSGTFQTTRGFGGSTVFRPDGGLPTQSEMNPLLATVPDSWNLRFCVFAWPRMMIRRGGLLSSIMTSGRYSAYVWRYLKRFYGHLGEDGIITKRDWIMANYSKFLRPEYVRIFSTANPANNIYLSAYEGEKTAIVALNLSSADINQSFRFQNTTVQSYTP